MSKAVGGGLPLAVLGIKKQFDAWEPGHQRRVVRPVAIASWLPRKVPVW
jgi:4-aminobutyrate aminotransferase-like enzyme